MSETNAPEPRATEIDPRLFRDVLGHYPTGVVAVTAADQDGTPLGMVVGTFSSVSLDPPLVSFMPTAGSQTYARLRTAAHFCINVLAHDQQAICRTLSQRDPDKFDRVPWRLSAHGVPQLEDAVAHIHCDLAQEIPAGDHLIALCTVRDVEISRPVTPLLFFQGGYGGFSPTGMAAYVDADLISAVRVAERTRPQLTGLAERFGCSAAALVLVNDHEQTIGASAYGRRTEVNERLGVRIPLIPPLGEAAVAWSETYSARWLARIFPQDPETIEKYRERLERVRRNGYAISLSRGESAVDHEQLGEALHEYSMGQLTPARERAVRTVFAAASGFFGAELPDGGRTAPVASIVVPVLAPGAGDARTQSGMVLRLGELAAEATRAQISEWISAAQQAAAEISATLAGEGRHDFERYLASGLRDRA